jgi:phosphatidyl-myo-inositol dimannoside synthase
MTDALMVTSSFLPGRGGIENHLAELAAELAPRLAVMAQARRDGKPLPPDLGYPTVPYPRPVFLPTPGAVRAVLDAAMRLGVDRVLFGTPWPTSLMGPALRRAGISYAVMVHGAELLVPASLPIIRRRLARSLAEADLLFPISNFTHTNLRLMLNRFGLPTPPCALLSARVDLRRFRPDVDGARLRRRWGLGERPVVLCFGRLVKRKGVDRLIEAMPEISKRAPEVVLLVAGTGPQEKRLRRMAKEVDADVRFAGNVPPEDAPACYALCDVFALAVADRLGGLDTEGLGVVLLEAAACAKPCVTGRSGGTPEAVVHEVTGLVVDATNRREIIEAIVRLLRDSELAARMGAAGRRHATEMSRSATPPELLSWLGKTSTIG